MIRRTLHLVLLALLFSPAFLRAENFCIEEDLLRLDSVVMLSKQYDAQKKAEIESFKRSSGMQTTAKARFNYCQHLFEDYMNFEPDSAIHYARMAQLVANTNNMAEEKQLAMIDEAQELTLQGDLISALNMLEKIGNIENVAQELRERLASVYMDFTMRTFVKKLEGFATMNASDVWKKYSPYLAPDSWQRYYYATMLTREDHRDDLLRELNHTQQPSLKAAKLLVVLSQTCWRKKDTNAYLHWLILSAINDICCSNREASSLQYLVVSPYIKLDVERAFRYTMLCTETADIFNDQWRSMTVVKAHAKVTEAYQQQLKQHSRILFVVILLLIAALVAVGFLARNISKKRRQQSILLKRLEESNESLQVMVDKEKVMRGQLAKANALLKTEISYHNKNFFNVYHLISKYIADISEFKKMVHNLVTAGKYDKARRELDSNSNTEKYLKGFFEHFDKAFLLSHPDFVERFNALLREECRIVPPAPDVLTPELRIYALVSIGITDSVSIAQFLHYSTQTVYNYRLRVRHSASIPEKVFADTVAKLYEDWDGEEDIVG